MTSTTRVDMHCHSTASQVSKLGVQRAVGLPECATPPHEVYELAKRRGMDFVTITDHDTIDGVLQIADRQDVFVSEAFLAAHAQDQRLRLLLAGGGPEQERIAERLGGRAAMLGWLHGEELARAYASADAFLFCSQTDTFGQVILEAQASGLPVVAVDAGGPRALIEDGVSGRLCKPDARALAGALLELAAAPLRREQLAGAALSAVRERSWERALERLATGYDTALGARASKKRLAA